MAEDSLSCCIDVGRNTTVQLVQINRLYLSLWLSVSLSPVCFSLIGRGLQTLWTEVTGKDQSLHRLSHQTHNEAILPLLQLGPDNLGLGLIVAHRTAVRMRRDSVRKHDQSGSLLPGSACGFPKTKT